MLGIGFEFIDRLEAIEKAAQKAKRKTFGKAAARVRKRAVAMVTRSSEPSAAGEPPHTRGRNWLKRAILFAADSAGAVIGPRFSAVGTSMTAHEFGGNYLGANYPARPLMLPALEQTAEAFAGDWQGSIGE